MALRLEDVLLGAVRGALGGNQIFQQQQANQAAARQQGFENQLSLLQAQPQPVRRVNLADVFPGAPAIDLPETEIDAFASVFGPQEPADMTGRVTVTPALKTAFPGLSSIPEGTVVDVSTLSDFQRRPTIRLRDIDPNFPDLSVSEDRLAPTITALRNNQPIVVTEELKAANPNALRAFEVGSTIRPDVLQTLTSAEVARAGQDLDERRFLADREEFQKEFGLKESAQQFEQTLRTRQQDWTEKYQGLQAELAERGANLADQREAFNQAMEQKRLELDREVAANRKTLEEAKLELDRTALDFAQERFNLDLAFRQEQAALSNERWEREFALKESDQEFRQTLEQAGQDWTQKYQAALLALQERAADRADAEFNAEQARTDFNQAMEQVRLDLDRRVREGQLSIAQARQQLDERAQDFIEQRWNEVGRRTSEAEARTAESGARVAEATEGARIASAEAAAQQAGIDLDVAKRTLEDRVQQAEVQPIVSAIGAILDANDVGNIDPLDLVLLDALSQRGAVPEDLQRRITESPVERIPALKPLIDQLISRVDVSGILSSASAVSGAAGAPGVTPSTAADRVRRDALAAFGSLTQAAQRFSALSEQEKVNFAREYGLSPQEIQRILGAGE